MNRSNETEGERIDDHGMGDLWEDVPTSTRYDHYGSESGSGGE